MKRRSFIVEFILSTAVVFAGIALLSGVARVRAAAARSQPLSMPSGQILDLLAANAQLEGLEDFPREVEEQRDNYSYTHGRKVSKERQARKLRGWHQPKASASWRATLPPGNYELRLLHEATATGELMIQCAETSNHASISNTQKAKWATIETLTLDETTTIPIRVTASGFTGVDDLHLHRLQLRRLE